MPPRTHMAPRPSRQRLCGHAGGNVVGIRPRHLDYVTAISNEPSGVVARIVPCLLPPLEHFVDHIAKRRKGISTDVLHTGRASSFVEKVLVECVWMIGVVIGIIVPENIDYSRGTDLGMITEPLGTEPVRCISNKLWVNEYFDAALASEKSLELKPGRCQQNGLSDIVLNDKVPFNLIEATLVDRKISIHILPIMIDAGHSLWKLFEHLVQHIQVKRPRNHLVRLVDLARDYLAAHLGGAHVMLALKPGNALLAFDDRFPRLVVGPHLPF